MESNSLRIIKFGTGFVLHTVETLKNSVMKNLAFVLLGCFAFSFGVYADGQKASKYRKVTHNAFKPGEKLRYRLHYGVVDAGEATLEVKSTTKTVKGRELLHMVGRGKSLGSFDWFFKVRDRYETYMDKQGVFPWLFIRRVDEGGFKIKQDYVFRQDQNKVKNEAGKFYKTPPNIHDMLSSFYYARTLNLKGAKVGKEFTMNMFIDNEIHPFKIKYLGDETIKTRKGKFKCHKIRPVVMQGRVWENEEDLTMWVSADANKVPVQIKTKILVGSIKATLVGWEGLPNPLSKI